jgi:2-phosphoglycerate kinase
LAEGVERSWRVLLLGGTTAAGKSTVAPQVAKALGFALISADSIWRAITSVTTETTHPVLFQWPRPQVVPDDPLHLLQVHIEEAEAMTPALESFLTWELKEGNRFVMQGAWLTPAFAAKRCAESPEVRAVFIDEPDEAAIMSSILERSKRAEPDARQKIVGRVAWLYGNWLRDEAEQHGVTMVNRNPKETLAERIIAAAEGDAK